MFDIYVNEKNLGFFSEKEHRSVLTDKIKNRLIAKSNGFFISGELIVESGEFRNAE
ncbi:MAG: hypothetical protein LBP87_10700 [Planctomycetaceae bacterium]|nr:hypothetical protein [Planctomycetaceae bacterium]